MKCANCKGNHNTVGEVRNCFQTGDVAQCIHGMAAGTCVNCGWKRRKGIMHPIAATRDSFCWLCKEPIEVGQLILTHWNVRGWCHAGCYVERDLMQPDPTAYWLTLTSQGEPEFEWWWSRLLLLGEAADDLFAQAIMTEKELTPELLSVLKEDMGEEANSLADLVAESFFGDEMEWTTAAVEEGGLDENVPGLVRVGIGSGIESEDERSQA